MNLQSSLMAVSALTLASAAHAVTLTHFNNALTNAGFDVVDGLLVAEEDSTSNGDIASVEKSAISSGRLSEGFAEADLATGTLRASSTFAFSRADFGDSFRAATPSSSPFLWTSGDTATFSVDITGSITRPSSGIARNTSEFNILILNPGTLSAYADWLQGDGDAGAWSSQIITSFSYGLDRDGEVPTFIDENITSFPASREFAFNPGGDFDWVFTAIAHAGEGITADFSNTFAVSYDGPEGSITRSGSGLFPGTVAIPEPSSLFLLSVATLGVFGFRRRTIG